METVLAQTVSDWELIVCDSYSADGSWEFLQKFKNDPRVRLFQVPREGLYAGWNECLRRATGEFVYFATADDTAGSVCLERLSGALGSYSNVDLAICRYEVIDETGMPFVPQLRNVGSFYKEWLNVPHLRRGLLEFFVHVGLDTPSWGSMTAVMFRRRLLEKTGLFRTDCGAWADWYWAIRTSLFTDTLFVPEVLATWRRHSSQATQASNSIMVAKRRYRMLENVVQECLEYLPKSMTEDPQWPQALLRNSRGEYLKKIGLDRLTLLMHPMTLIKGAAYASIHEPHYLLARLLRGLTWEQDFSGNEEDYLRRLMERMSVPWPPTSLVLPRASILPGL
jgi:glycosyltransferase involved in cell wall biosynthesis